MSTYAIVEDCIAITCLLCNRTSWNSEDVRHKYCAACDVFHEDMLYKCGFCGCRVTEPCTVAPADYCTTALEEVARTDRNTP